MRQKTIHRLANLGRIGALALTGLGLAVLLVFEWRGDLVDPVEDWLRLRLEGRYIERWRAALALAATDPVAAEKALVAFSQDLQGVQKLDRLALVVQQTEPLLLQAASQRGDLASAIEHARRLCRLDDRDLVAAARLATLLGRSASTRQEGIDLLQRARVHADGSAVVAAPLCELLLDKGDRAAAAAVLQTAADHVVSNLWNLRWGQEPDQTGWLLPRRRGDGSFEARFAIEEPVGELLLQAPNGAAIALCDATLQLEGEDGPKTLSLKAWQTGLWGMRWDGDAAIAGGADWQVLHVPFGKALPAPVTVTLLWHQEPLLADWLRQLLLGRVGRSLVDASELAAANRAALLRLRARALANAPLQLWWRADAAAAEQRIDGSLHGTAGDAGLEFEVRFALPGAAHGIGIALPATVAALRPVALQCLDDRGEVLAGLDPALPTNCSDVVIGTGEWRVTGASPRLDFAMPESARHCASIVLRGVAR